jgi:hypothetical protein
MHEVNIFNALHILLIVLISNIIINNDWEFLVIHIVIAYIVLTALKIN